MYFSVEKSQLSEKVIRPRNGNETACAGNDHIISTAGTVDHQQISVLVSAANNTDMGIVRVKHQVTGLGVRPRNISAIRVLHGGAAAMSDDVAAARGVVKGPIDE